MTEERRRGDEARAALKRQLNEDQRLSLAEMERFGWELRFVRHPPFKAPIAVLMDSERRQIAVLEADGRVNNSPALVIRQ